MYLVYTTNGLGIRGEWVWLYIFKGVLINNQVSLMMYKCKLRFGLSDQKGENL